MNNPQLCPKCATPVQPGAAFCMICGSRLPAPEAGAEPSAAQSSSAPTAQAKAEYMRGRELWTGKRLDEAEAAYRSAIELDPALPHPYYDLAMLLESRGRPAEEILHNYQVFVACAAGNATLESQIVTAGKRIAALRASPKPAPAHPANPLPAPPPVQPQPAAPTSPNHAAGGSKIFRTRPLLIAAGVGLMVQIILNLLSVVGAAWLISGPDFLWPVGLLLVFLCALAVDAGVGMLYAYFCSREGPLSASAGGLGGGVSGAAARLTSGVVSACGILVGPLVLPLGIGAADKVVSAVIGTCLGLFFGAGLGAAGGAAMAALLGKGVGPGMPSAPSHPSSANLTSTPIPPRVAPPASMSIPPKPIVPELDVPGSLHTAAEYIQSTTAGLRKVEGAWADLENWVSPPKTVRPIKSETGCLARIGKVLMLGLRGISLLLALYWGAVSLDPPASPDEIFFWLFGLLALVGALAALTAGHGAKWRIIPNRALAAFWFISVVALFWMFYS